MTAESVQSESVVVNELVETLHHLYAAAIDTGGQTEEEAQVIFDRAKLLLSEHGVEV